jgi:tRNA threonylcarbamoyladenosine biosynthesis protein TsaE
MLFLCLRWSWPSRYYTGRMNTSITWQINSSSSEATEQLGFSIGSRLRGGEVLELRSDLGGGKTTFVRGLAAGMGSEDVVASPSFTISKVYSSEHLELHHYDFYRLPEAGLMAQELGEVIADPQNVVIVEWAEVVDDILPAQHAIVTIRTTGETTREITIHLPSGFEYLKGDAA